jgi:penicillin-binding protein 1A
MTDLLQSAVMSGTGSAAQIGRPVAGKTGTTSSNKDGWFVGFSSGLTTGVWMGRDDARPVGGLQGGTAPARAFHDFMAAAVANRPVEQFETQVPMPDWQLTPEEEMLGNEVMDPGGLQPMVDENGMPLPQDPTRYPPQPTLDQPFVRPDGSGYPSQQELDQAFPPQQRPQRPAPNPPQRQPDPRLAPADPPEDGRQLP